jgi:HSF-type DNA-binding
MRNKLSPHPVLNFLFKIEQLTHETCFDIYRCCCFRCSTTRQSSFKKMQGSRPTQETDEDNSGRKANSELDNIVRRRRINSAPNSLTFDSLEAFDSTSQQRSIHQQSNRQLGQQYSTSVSSTMSLESMASSIQPRLFFDLDQQNIDLMHQNLATSDQSQMQQLPPSGHWLLQQFQSQSRQREVEFSAAAGDTFIDGGQHRILHQHTFDQHQEHPRHQIPISQGKTADLSPTSNSLQGQSGNHQQCSHPPYRDFSTVTDPNLLIQIFRRQPVINKEIYPVVLHTMLERCSNAPPKFEGIIYWHPHGRSFFIKDKKRFINEILPIFFPGQSQYSSFHRQLNNYGILRLTRPGPDHNTFYHELLLRDRPFLATFIQRSRYSTSSVRQSLDPLTEPEFLHLPFVHTLPNTNITGVISLPTDATFQEHQLTAQSESAENNYNREMQRIPNGPWMSFDGGGQQETKRMCSDSSTPTNLVISNGKPAPNRHQDTSTQLSTTEHEEKSILLDTFTSVISSMNSEQIRAIKNYDNHQCPVISAQMQSDNISNEGSFSDSSSDDDGHEMVAFLDDVDL